MGWAIGGNVMRAVGIKAFGGPEVLEILDLKAADPGPGQVQVKVAFAGVNPIDVHVRRGAYLGSVQRPPEWPMVLGYEGSGEVETVGSGVDGIKPGQRVAWCGQPGSHAETANVAAWRLMPVPDQMPLDIACALQLDGMLAHALCVTAFPVGAGDRVLVHAGADPTSQLLIQIAKGQGAEVIATVARDTDKGAPKAAGADHVIGLAGGDAVAAIRELTGGAGCHVVFDSVGRDTIAASIACCRRRGMVVLFGGQSGAVDTIRPDDLAAAGSIYLTRPHIADYMQDATEVRWRMAGLFDAWAAGQLKVGIGRILPLDGTREGHLAIEAGTAAGKILIKMQA